MGGHLGYGGYYGHGLGYTTYYGKREAEAEPKAAADPYLLYGGYYGHGLGYGYSGLGYHGLGYRVYGKRSADAEPKADPYLLYGGYRHLGRRTLWIPIWWICLLWISYFPSYQNGQPTILV